MHEVSLRAASNRMDAHNLAVVLCPNLVSGPDPMRDVAMCAVPGGPALYDSSSVPSVTAAQPPEGRTTLGAVIKLCIQRYYEVFDEVRDRSEAIPLPYPRLLRDEPASPGGSSLSSGNRRFSAFQNDDEDSIDDAMLVMPIGPSSPQQATFSASTSSTFKARHRSNKSGGGSMHAIGENGNGFQQAAVNKAKSMVSIENGNGAFGTRRGSITVGRGTTRKASGAGVEAVGITAGGFFSAPNTVPPVPPLPSTKPSPGAHSPQDT